MSDIDVTNKFMNGLWNNLLPHLTKVRTDLGTLQQNSAVQFMETNDQQHRTNYFLLKERQKVVLSIASAVIADESATATTKEAFYGLCPELRPAVTVVKSTTATPPQKTAGVLPVGSSGQ